jgi:GTP-binding protein LepA
MVYSPETSQALNFGFRSAFWVFSIWKFSMERLEREYDLDIVLTAATVEYR